MTLLQHLQLLPPIPYLRTFPQDISNYENTPNAVLTTLATLTITVATAIFVYKQTLSISLVGLYIPFSAVLSYAGCFFADNIFRLKKPVIKDVFEVIAIPLAATVTIVVARFFRIPSTLAYAIAPIGGFVGFATTLNLLEN